MRTLILALFVALCILPASAQDWSSYGNGRFGYELAIPPNFVGQGESDNGDGQAFAHKRGAQQLTVWGGLPGVVSEAFEAEVAAQMADAEADGWILTYQATTGQWASFSGTKGSRILYQRVILLCDRESYAAFRLDYGMREAAAIDAVVSKLVGSLRKVC